MPRAQFLDTSWNLPLPEVAIDEPGGIEMSVQMVLVDFRINVAGDVEDVRPAIVVIVHETRRPSTRIGC